MQDEVQSFSEVHPPIRPSWLAAHREEILEPELPIIDAHHHLWIKPQHRYVLEELLQDIGAGHNVRATVFVQCFSMYRANGPAEFRVIGETEFVNGIAAQCASGLYGDIRACAGIVSNADFTLGDAVVPVLEAHIRAAPDRFRGIRTTVAAHASPHISTSGGQAPLGLMNHAQFRRGFSHLARHGLLFDAWVFHSQLTELLHLARDFPDTQIVIDHVGGPLGIAEYAGKRAEVFADWSEKMKLLASCGNVSVKLGGLGMVFFGFPFFERATPPSSEELATAWRPYVELCIEAFGTRRCMFQSNFPVDKAMCSYPVLWNAFKRLSRNASPSEKADLFSGTASRVYSLDLKALLQ